MPISVEEHLATLLALVAPLGAEEVPVGEALGRGLATDVIALADVPPFDTSAMDGFALRAAEATAGAVLPVVADLPAAPGEVAALPPGSAARIMTGAPVPAGADAVVMVEDTDQAAGPATLPTHVRVNRAPADGANVRRRGEDVMAGTPVLAAGTVLTAAALASAISVGHGTLEVHRNPRVAVLSTGSELVAPGVAAGPGQIPDSNGTLLAALARAAGHEVTHTERVPDDVAALREALARAADAADLVVTSGGVSAGAYDVVKEATAGIGFAYSRVAMQPGKPQGHGLLTAGGRRVPVLALPGNPVSVFVSFHLFVRPVLDALAGRTVARGLLAARAGSGWSSPAGRRQYIPVHLSAPTDLADPVPVARPTHRLGSASHLVASLHRANAIAIVPEDRTAVEEGELLPVMLVEGF